MTISLLECHRPLAFQEIIGLMSAILTAVLPFFLVHILSSPLFLPFTVFLAYLLMVACCPCCAQPSLLASVSGHCFLGTVLRLLIVVTPLVAERRHSGKGFAGRWTSVVVGLGL